MHGNKPSVITTRPASQWAVWAAKEHEKQLDAIPLARQVLQQLSTVRTSHKAFYSAINFVALLNKLEQPAQILPLTDLAQLMATTVHAAQQTQNPQAEAYALNQWGQLYCRSQQWTEAQHVTTRFLALARQLQSHPLIAQSAWQLGRLYRQQDNIAAAIAVYTEAVQSLQAMRSDLIAVNAEVQFSFRAQVEPVYRELVSLLLSDRPSQAALTQARGLIESLQIAELDNFFREACLDRVQQIDQVDPTAAVVYPITIFNRDEVPEGKLPVEVRVQEVHERLWRVFYRTTRANQTPHRHHCYSQ